MEVHVHDELTGGGPRRKVRRAACPWPRGRWSCAWGSARAAPALAITLNVTHSGPSVVGEAHAFTASVPDAIGAVSYEWQFSETDDFQPGGAAMSHTYTAPGLYSVQVNATDSTGDTASVFFRHLVHYPLTATRPTSSTSIVYDSARNRIYSVNQDNDTVTAIDPDKLVKVGELGVYRKPESLALTPAESSGSSIRTTTRSP